jgi:predicted nucleic acid-binding protein
MPKREAEGTARHDMLVLDASVLINLLGSGHVEVVLRAWKGSVVMVDRTFREVLRDPSGRMPSVADRQFLVDQGLIRVEALNSEAVELFVDLVSAPDALDDGEAATIAFAVIAEAVAVLDERRARRIVRERFPELALDSTAGLLRRLNEDHCLLPDTIREVLFAALQKARMSIVAEEMNWAIRTLGVERARQCPSIPRSALRDHGDRF